MKAIMLLIESVFTREDSIFKRIGTAADRSQSS